MAMGLCIYETGWDSWVRLWRMSGGHSMLSTFPPLLLLLFLFPGFEKDEGNQRCYWREITVLSIDGASMCYVGDSSPLLSEPYRAARATQWKHGTGGKGH